MTKTSLSVIALLASAAAAGACSAGSGDPDGTGGKGNLELGTGGTGLDPNGQDTLITNENALGISSSTILTPECDADCPGFSDPANPDQAWVFVDGSVSADQMTTLDAGGTEGLCVSEPATGTVFPAAWTRPRFNAGVTAGPSKVVLSTGKMKHDLTIYSDSATPKIPLEAWEALSLSVYNEDITYTFTAGGQTGTGSFQIAPVAAGGSMVYWGSDSLLAGETTNALYGFGVGDEGVIRAIYPGEIQGTQVADNGDLRTKDTTTDGHSTCIGCHSSTPDGQAIASVDDWPWNTRVYSIEAGSTGAPPDYMTPAGAAMVSMTWLGQTTFSAGDWATDARRLVTNWTQRDLEGPSNSWSAHTGADLSNQPTELIWIDLASPGEVPTDISRIEPETYDVPSQQLSVAVSELKGTGWDVISRGTTDPNSPVFADWSHDGKTIAYVSTDAPDDGRIGQSTAVDLYTVPFNGGAGGDAAPVPGASEADAFEYYPDYSPDDALLAFNKIAAQTALDVYYRPESEIYVIPSDGGTATRLAANDAACGEGTVGQMYNSWAKWSPSTASDGERTYYFLIFSTSRNSPFEVKEQDQSVKGPATQLYMTTVIEESDGSITSSPAIYLWNQRNLVSGEGDSATVSELLTNNVTPAWDEFKLPPVPEVVIR